MYLLTLLYLLIYSHDITYARSQCNINLSYYSAIMTRVPLINGLIFLGLAGSRRSRASFAVSVLVVTCVCVCMYVCPLCGVAKFVYM